MILWKNNGNSTASKMKSWLKKHSTRPRPIMNCSTDEDEIVLHCGLPCSGYSEVGDTAASSKMLVKVKLSL
jgi:hypothetical protein